LPKCGILRSCNKSPTGKPLKAGTRSKQNFGISGLIVFAPNADLGRDIRWGRTEECYGEDPFLTGILVTAYVKGLQGNNPYMEDSLTHEALSGEQQ